MAVFTRIKTWVSNEVLTASDLNNEFNNIINNMQPTGIEDYSTNVSEMQTTADPGGLGTESLATTLAGEITRLRFAIKRIVGKAQWYIAPDFDLDGQLGTSNIADGAITVDKIGAGSVTLPKLAATTASVSTTSTGTYSTTSGTYADVTNAIITDAPTNSRPVNVVLIPDGTSSSNFSGLFTVGGVGCIALLRDGVIIAESRFGTVDASGSSCPPGAFQFPDFGVTAATHTYKIQAKVLTTGTASVWYCKLAVLPML